MPADAACQDTDLAWLLDENRQALAQLSDLVARLAPDDYCRPFGADGRHTLGKHVRHIIDHYEALLAQARSGADLDYEHRRREAALEQSPPQVVCRLEAITVALDALGEASLGRALTLRYAVDTTRAELPMATSLERELAFLTSHTIHHMAIIGLLAESLDVPLPETFGVHPSTLRHWQRLSDISVPRTAGSAADREACSGESQ